MKTGQFYRGKIDGIQKNFESPDLDKILPTEKLADLANYTEIGEHPRFFKKEKVLTKTVITEAENSDGRRGGIINFTVLYGFEQTVTQDTINYVFPLDEFIAEILDGKRHFKMPPPPTLPETDSNFALIEPPPPIIWENDD
jgi:hypothetical protein